MYKKLTFLVLLIGLSIPNLLGQFCPNPPLCLTNGQLEPDDPSLVGFDMNDIVFGGPGTNVNGWSVSHGSPTIANGLSGDGIWMWARTYGIPYGEGIYACYNFQQGHTYQVCYWVRNTTATNRGNLFVRAVTGLVPNPFYSAIPAVPVTSEIIDNAHVNTAIWTQYNVVYVPNDNYNGIWIYPFSAFADSPQYELIVDNIRINEAQPNNLAVTASASTNDACGSSTLSVNGALANSTYIWTPAAGLSSTTGATVIAQPCSTTTYTVEIHNPCQNSICLPFIQKQVTVTVQPGTSATASPPTINVCGSSTLTATSTNPMNVTWSPAAGLSSTHGNVVTASPCSTTTYTATFYCPQNGCSYTEQVTVYVQPNGGIVDSSSSACYGQIKMEYIANPPCPGSTYKWYGPNNTLLSTNQKFVKGSSTPSDQGTYKVEVTTPQGCVDSFYTIVKMNCCKVVADFNIIDCNPVRFENTTLDSVGGDTILQGQWYWDFGDGTTSSIRNPSHLYTTIMGPTTVCLTAVITDSSHFSTCCDKICKDFVVCDFACDPKAAFGFRVVKVSALGVDIQLLDKSVGGGTPNSWEWTVDGVLHPVTTDSTPIINGLTSGIHHICLKVGFLQGNGQICFETWCEDIVVP